jgi:hypothetical protein
MYEYMTIQATPDYIEDRINERAKDGWRVVGYSCGAGEMIFVLLERQTPK